VGIKTGSNKERKAKWKRKEKEETRESRRLVGWGCWLEGKSEVSRGRDDRGLGKALAGPSC
jgi:hypothetical protein